MGIGISRRSALSGLLSVSATVGLAAPPERSLRPVARAVAALPDPENGPDVAQLIAASGVTGKVAAALADLDSGDVIDGYHVSTALPPASVAKVPTALYALENLGADYRHFTRIFADAPVRGGKIDGNLIFSGGGDPTLHTNQLAGLARRLAATGVKSITGKFLVWDGALPYSAQIDPGQMPHLGYNPAISGLNLNYNRIHFEWVREGDAYTVSMDARSELYRPDVTMAQMKIVERGAPIYTFTNGEDRDDWTVAESALGDGGARWLPVRHPALYAGDVFRTMARAQGITLPKPQKAQVAPRGTLLATHYSAPLTEIVAGMLKYSTNITAEALGQTASTHRMTELRSLRQSAREMSVWLLREKGCAARMIDHSGLGDASRVSASAMVRLLTGQGAEAQLRPLLKPLAMRDANGRPVPDHPVTVVAKTGTLNFVSTLAGYVTTASGKRRAFAIFAADEGLREAGKLTGAEVPRGARSWSTRARNLQHKLLLKWGAE